MQANLKISPSHYEQMKTAIASALESHPKAWQSYKDGGASHKRFRWDAWRFAKIGGDSARWACSYLYCYLDDTHIDSALRSIMRELGQPTW